MNVQDLAVEVAGVCALALEASGDAPKTVVVVDGDPVFDSCCDGAVYVQVDSVYEIGTFPDPPVDYRRCGGLTAARMTVTALRCVTAKPSAGGSPGVRGSVAKPALPSVDQIMTDSRQVHDDAEQLLVHLAVLRNTWWDERHLRSIVGEWLPTGPEGGCHGGTVTLTVELPKPAAWPTLQ